MGDAQQEDRRLDEDEEEEEEEIDGSGYQTVKDAVLFAVDVSDSMLALPQNQDFRNKDRDSATLAALKCAYQLMQQRIISNPNDMMGVLLFGTKESKFLDDDGRSTERYPYCYVLTDLDVPAATDVKRLRDLVNEPEEAAKLLVPTEEAVSMANVMFCANQIFTTKAPNFTSRRLFLVTDNDSPHDGEKAAKDATAVRAKDLYDLGVVIELFPIAQAGQEFDRTRFYDDIIYRGGGLDPEAPAPVSKVSKASTSGDGISLLQSLISEVNSKAVARRAYFTLPLEVGPELAIGVKGFIIIKRQAVAKSCWVWVGGDKVQMATGMASMITQDTAKSVEKSELRKAFKFGGVEISFTEDELKQLQSTGERFIRVIGFKSLDLLPTWANTKTQLFIYPEETNYVGSTRVFSALQQKLLRDDKFALVWYKPRVNGNPTLAAMIAGEEKLDDAGDQIMPPGLWLIPLPFADDIRKQPEVPQARSPDNLVEKMKVVIEQLRLPKGEYTPSRYPNPSLQKFYRILQALALEEEIPEEFEDKTIPRYKQIYKRTGNALTEWNEELDSSYQELERSRPVTTLATHHKRGASDGGPPPAKRVKQEDEMSDEIMKKHYQKETVGRLTIPQIIGWLKQKGIKTHFKKKADLVGVIEGYFEENT